MPRRVFVAIMLPETLRPEVQRLQSAIPFSCAHVPSANLHLTLIPPWQEDDLVHVKEALARIASHQRFSLRFGRVMLGPQPERPRLIWIRGSPSKELGELKEHVESLLGIRHDRKFIPHITIARFPETSRPKAWEDLVRWDVQVREIALVESRLLPTGSVYTVLATFPLGEG
jgi:2'-5' RNA ligase